MARKRLGPARDFGTDPDPEIDEAALAASPESKAMFPRGAARLASHAAPPIARVSGEAAAHAAAERLADDIRAAREGGRLVVDLALEDVAEAWLLRDRISADPEELEVLKTSLRERGQQAPIEVVDLGPAAAPRYGLVSGWRRLTALRALAAEGAAGLAVRALLRRPETTADAYRAMVEENEIRVGLSYYERARITAEAADRGIYPDRAAALAGLFAAASRAKRSKIGSFMRLHDALGARLAFPAAIPERLGLALARALEDAGFAARLADRLRKARPASAEAELALLEKALAERGPAADGLVANGPAARTPGAGRDRPVAVPDEARPEDGGDAALPAAPGKVHLRRLETGGILIYGTGADRAFEADLAAWIAARQDRD